jgi:hypothetical protein
MGEGQKVTVLERFQKEWMRLGKRASAHYMLLILAAFFIIRFGGWGFWIGTAFLFLIFAFAIGYWILVAVRAYQGKR